LCIPYVNPIYFSPRGKIYKNWGGVLGVVSDCEELVGCNSNLYRTFHK